MIEVKRKPNEPVGAFLRRFSRRVMQSGLVKRVRNRRYYVTPPTKREKRLSALYRIEKQKETEKLIKLGKIKETPKRR